MIERVDAPRLCMWTIYDHPKDFPHSFVARMHEIGPGWSRPTDEVIVAPTLAALRVVLVRDKHLKSRMDRFPDDDANIVETWM